GKNPSDVWNEMFEDFWDIPNVKAKHPEKTDHPCQFPSAIPIRLIKALTNEGDLVLDPFMGSGTKGISAILTNRKFCGSEWKKSYFQIAKEKIGDALNGIFSIREDIPVREPDKNEKVAKKPEFFK